MDEVTKDLLGALKIVTSQLERVGDTRRHKDGEFIDLGRAAIARAEAALDSSDDTPPSTEERRLRRMLCRQRHGVSAYMDDGEATFGGDEFQRPTDYLRESLDSIEQAWIEDGRKQGRRVTRLNPCPLCGGEAALSPAPFEGCRDIIQCGACGLLLGLTKKIATREGLVAAWNTRAVSSSQADSHSD